MKSVKRSSVKSKGLHHQPVLLSGAESKPSSKIDIPCRDCHNLECFKMPEVISVGEFIEETRDDFHSPTTSTFVSRIPHCRNAVNHLEEVRPLVTLVDYLFISWILFFVVFNVF